MGKLNWNNLVPAVFRKGETSQPKGGTSQSKGGKSQSKGGTSQSKGKG